MKKLRAFKRYCLIGMICKKRIIIFLGENQKILIPSDVVINEVANRTASGLDEQQTMAGAAKAYEREYIRQQEEMLAMVEENEDYDMGANY